MVEAVARLLGRLEGVRKIGGKQWMACCPAHDDDKPSLHVSVGREGRALVCCQAGCPYEKVLAAVGLRAGDLFSGSTRGQPAGTGTTPLLFKTAREAVGFLSNKLGNPVGIWCYYDYFRRPVGVVARFHDAHGGKTYRQVSRHPSGRWWCKGMPPPRPLYRLQELLHDKGHLAFVVEGEKCADALAATGITIPVVTNAGGSNSWQQTDWSPLRGRRVVVLPDNDTPGRAMASNLKTWLHRLGVQHVRVVQLPGLPPKGDVFDWLRTRAADLKWLCSQFA